MPNPLDYPFDPQWILKKRKSIKKELLASGLNFLDKKIAILGGSTTHDIKEMLELFLLNNGIRPTFYESDFGRYWQDAMFTTPDLETFKPDIIFIHTSNRNISAYPTVKDTVDQIDALLDQQFRHFEEMWNKLSDQYACPIIQNNFELPYYRLMGNKDSSDPHGRINFINRLNALFTQYAQAHNHFYIHDIHYLSASYGLEQWSDPSYWHMYKYCLSVPAIPYFSYNLANIIKSIFGKNKKALVLDLDNTLWGGVIGDDGIEGIEIGHETPMGQLYSEFQSYLKELKDLGIMLTVNSKNELKNAEAGLNHPEGTLRPDDFLVIKANCQTKAHNIQEIAQEINIGTDSLVFFDDNPVERDIVTSQIPRVVAPSIQKPEEYILTLDRSGYFEVTSLSEDDLKRNEMYKANLVRIKEEQSFQNYDDYLKSLNMTAVIKDFDDLYIPRITQLINKTNQFNLTTKRFTQNEIEEITADRNYLRLYGKLTDKFGDNGLISVVIGKIEKSVLHIELWLMSCRVLKRNMEHAMLDALVAQAKKAGISRLQGYYFKTVKNEMVKEFYGEMGFDKLSQNGENSVWELDLSNYQEKNQVIQILHE